MTKQEYREALHEINVKAENERRVLARAFATEHSPVNVGDYISDHCDTIRVESWDVVNGTYEYPLPCLVYRGMTCKKDGTPRKNPKRCSISVQPLAGKWRTSKESRIWRIIKETSRERRRVQAQRSS